MTDTTESGTNNVQLNYLYNYLFELLAFLHVSNNYY